MPRQFHIPALGRKLLIPNASAATPETVDLDKTAEMHGRLILAAAGERGWPIRLRYVFKAGDALWGYGTYEHCKGGKDFLIPDHQCAEAPSPCPAETASPGLRKAAANASAVWKAEESLQEDDDESIEEERALKERERRQRSEQVSSDDEAERPRKSRKRRMAAREDARAAPAVLPDEGRGTIKDWRGVVTYNDDRQPQSRVASGVRGLVTYSRDWHAEALGACRSDRKVVHGDTSCPAESFQGSFTSDDSLSGVEGTSPDGIGGGGTWHHDRGLQWQGVRRPRLQLIADTSQEPVFPQRHHEQFWEAQPSFAVTSLDRAPPPRPLSSAAAAGGGLGSANEIRPYMSTAFRAPPYDVICELRRCSAGLFGTTRVSPHHPLLQMLGFGGYPDVSPTWMMVQILMDYTEDVAVIMWTLRTLCDLTCTTAGGPSIHARMFAELRGCERLVWVLKYHANSSVVLSPGLKLVSQLAQDASNRKQLAGVCAVVASSLFGYHDNEEIRYHGCAAVASLATDSEDNAAMLGAASICEAVCAVLHLYVNDLSAQRMGCAAVAKLAWNCPENLTRLWAAGAGDLVCSTMRHYTTTAVLQYHGALAIAALAAAPDCRSWLGSLGACEVLCGALCTFHGRERRVHLAACQALIALSTNHESNRRKLVALGAPSAITMTLNAFTDLHAEALTALSVIRGAAGRQCEKALYHHNGHSSPM